MNKRTVMRRALAVVLLASAAAVGVRAQDGGAGTDDLSIGERMWPSVSNGLVFIDGKYLPPPYVISRRECSIFVNGHGLAWLGQWPPAKPPPPPETKPVMPVSITEKTLPHDKDLLAYTSSIRTYLMAKYGEQDGCDRMVDIYRELPCVKSAQRQSHSIEVIWLDGSRGGILQIPSRRHEAAQTKEDAEKLTDHFSEGYRQKLDDCHYFILEQGGLAHSGTMQDARLILLPLADAIHATENEDGFLATVKTNQPPCRLSEKTLRLFYRHRDDMQEWESRLRFPLNQYKWWLEYEAEKKKRTRPKEEGA